MSQTIDNKVVEMRFDNSNFEKNIAQSMQSLKNIENQLNNLDKTKGLEALNDSAKKVDLSHAERSLDSLAEKTKKMDFSNMQHGLEQAKIKFSALQVAGATVVSELTKKAMGLGKALVQNTVGQIKSGGLTRALNIDQAQFQIEGLGKKWSDVKHGIEKGVKADVLKAVQGTAYGLDEAARVSSQLLASNVKTGKEMQGVLRGISGVAAMTNSSYSEIGNIFTKVAGNGRMMSDELLQLSSRGMNAAATLRDFANSNDEARKKMIKVGLASKQAKEVQKFAKATKLTEGNIRTLTTAGAVDFKTFSDAMNKAFGKQAAKANKTYSGALANMKAALSRIGADIQTTKIEVLRKIFIALTKVIDKAHEALQPFLNALSDHMEHAGKKAIKFIKKFGKVFDKPTLKFKQWHKVSNKGFVNKAFKKSLIQAAKESDVPIKKLIKQHGSFRKSLKGNWLTQDIFSKALNRFSGKNAKSYKAIAALNKKTALSYSTLDKVSNKVIRGDFGNGAERYKKLTKAGYDYNAVQGLVNHKLIKTDFNYKKYTKTIGKLSDKQLKQQGYTKSEIKALKELAKQSKKTGTPINKLMEQMSKPTPFQATVMTLKTALKSTKRILGAFGKAISSVFFGKKKSTLAESILNFRDSIKVTKKEANTLQKKLKIVLKFIKTGFGTAYGIVKQFAGAFKDLFFGPKTENPKWGASIVELTKKIKISDKTLANFRRTFKGLFAAIDIVRMILSGPLKLAFSIIKNVLGNFNIGITDGAATIGDYIVKLRDWIKNSGPFAKILQTGIKFISILITYIIKLSKKLIDLSKGPIDKIKKAFDKVKKLFAPATKGIKSFISTFQTTKKFDFKTLSSGFKGLFENLSKWFSEFWPNIKTNFLKGVDNIKNALDSKGWVSAKTFDNIVDFFKKHAGKLSVIVDIIKKPFTAIKDKIEESFNFKGVKLFKGIAESKNKKTISNLVDTKDLGEKGFIIEDFFKKITETIKNFFSFITGSTPVKADSIVDTGGVKVEGKQMVSALDGIKMGLSGFIKWIKNFFKSVDFYSVAGLAGIAATFGILYKTVKTISKFESPLKRLTDSVSGFFNTVSGTLKEYQKNMKVDRVVKVILAFVALAGALYLLSKVAWQDLFKAVGALAAMAIVIGALAAATSKLKAIQIDNLASTMVGLSVAILIITFALSRLGKQAEKGTLYVSLGALAGILIGVGAFLIALGKFGKAIEVGAREMVLIAASIVLITMALQRIADLQIDNVPEFLAKLTLVLGILVSVFMLTMFVGTISVGTGPAILAITISMILFVELFKMLDGLNIEHPIKVLIAMKVLIGAIAAMLFMTNLIGPNAAKAGLSIGAIGLAFYLIVLAIKKLDKIPQSAIDKGIALLWSFTGMVAILMIATRVAGKNSKTVMMALISFAAVMVILVALIAFIGNMDDKKLRKGLVTVVALGVIVAVVMNVSKHASKIGIASLFSIVIAIGILAGAVYLLGLIDPNKVKVGTLAIMALGLTVAAIMKYSENTKKLKMASFWSLIAAIVALSGAVFALGLLNPTNVITGTACIVALGILVITMTKIAGHTKKLKMASFWSLIAAIGALTMAVFLLGQLDPTKAIVGTACVVALGVLVIVLTRLAQNAGKIGIASLFVMVAAIALLAGVVYLLGTLDPTKVITATACVIALGVLVGILMVISSAVGPEAIPGMLLVMGVMIVVGAVLYLLASYTDTDKVTKIAISISILLLTLAGVLLVCALLGALCIPAAIGAALLLGFIAAVSVLLVTMGALATVAGGLLEKGASTLLAIGTFLNLFMVTAGDAIMQIMNLAVIIGALAPLAIVGLTLLMTFLATMTIIMIVLGALSAIAEPFINKGGPLLVKIGSYIGQFVGAFIGGIAEQAAQSLPMLAAALSTFGIGITPFVNAMNNMPGDIVGKIGGLVAAILAIIATDFISKITGFLTGGDPIDDFISTLVRLGKGLSRFGASIEGLDPLMAVVATQTLKGIAQVRNSLDSEGGILGFFAGNKDIDGFGRGIVSLALGLNSFIRSIDPSIDVAKIMPFISVIRAIAQISDVLPNTGGVAGFFAGDTDWDGFGKGITSMAGGLKDLADKTSEIKDPEKLKVFIGLIKDLAKIQEDLPNVGGVAGFFAGDIDWSVLGDGMTEMATAFEETSKTLSGKKMNLDGISTMTNILSEMVKINDSAIKITKKKEDKEDSDSFVSEIFEPVKNAITKIKEYQKTVKEKDMDELVVYFSTLKTFINKLSKEFSGKDSKKNLELVKTVGETLANLLLSVTKIQELMTGDKKAKKNDRTIADKLSSFAGAVIEFADAMAGINNKGVENAKSVVTSLKGMSDLKISKFENAKSSVDNLKAALTAFKALNDKDNKLTIKKGKNNDDIDTLKTYVSKIKSTINSFAKDLDKKALKKVSTFGSQVKTFSDGLKAVADAFSSIAKTTVNAEKGKEVKDAMDEVSKASVKSFYKGLKGKVSDVKTAFNSLLNKVRDYAKKEHPGTVGDMQTAGINLVKGFVKGIDSMKGAVKDKLKEVMEASIEVTMKTLDENSPSKIYDKIGQNMIQGQINGVLRMGTKLESALGNVNNNAIKSSAVSAALALNDPIAKIDNAIKSIKKKIENNKSIKKAINNNLKAIKKHTKAIKKLRKAKKKSKSKSKDAELTKKINKHKKRIKALKASNKTKKKKLESSFKYGTDKYIKSYILKYQPEVLNKSKKNVENYVRQVRALQNAAAESLYKATNPDEYAKDKKAMNDATNKRNTAQNTINNYEKGKVKVKLSKINKNTPKSKDKKIDPLKQYNTASKKLKKTNKKIKHYKDLIKMYGNQKSKKKKVKKWKNKISRGSDLRNKKMVYKERKQNLKKVLKPYFNAKTDKKNQDKIFKDAQKTFDENVTSTLKEMTDSVKDNMHSFLDPLSNAVDTGISLFEKFEKGTRISSGRLVKNMESQVKAASDYANDIAKLEQTGLDRGLINKLKSEGISGWNKVKAALGADNNQIARMNSAFTAEKQLNFESIMKKLQDRINFAGSWDAKITKLSERGLNSETIRGILSMGIEEAEPYIDALLQATPAQLKEFNNKIKTAKDLEDKLSIAGFNHYTEAVRAETTGKAKETGWNYNNGLIAGLTDKTYLGKLVQAGSTIGQTINNAVQNRLGIHSPATTGIENGKFTVLGLVKGVMDNINLVRNAGEDLANAILNPMDNLGDVEDPTITPILDLDRLESDLEVLDNMFKSPYTLDIAASVSKVGTGSQNVQNGDIVNNYHNEFTQNNYSPKALDEAEIYRRNKNFINSKVKGGIVR